MFLKRTAGLAVFLAAGGVGRHLLRHRPRPPAGLHFLDADEAETLSKLADILLPPEEGFPTNGEINLLARLDHKIGELTRAERRDLKALLQGFESLAPILGPALGTFSSLTPAEQHRYVWGWAHSRLKFKRVGFAALKQLVMFTYYTHEKTWPSLGFKGTWVGPLGRGGQ